MSGPVVIDGCDAAILGYCDTPDGIRVIYGYEDLVGVFAQEMGHEGAVEWVEFNVVRGIDYLTGRTPIIMYPGNRDLVDELADSEDE